MSESAPKKQRLAKQSQALLFYGVGGDSVQRLSGTGQVLSPVDRHRATLIEDAGARGRQGEG